jgi:hypothetical protein
MTVQSWLAGETMKRRWSPVQNPFAGYPRSPADRAPEELGRFYSMAACSEHSGGVEPPTRYSSPRASLQLTFVVLTTEVRECFAHEAVSDRSHP